MHGQTQGTPPLDPAPKDLMKDMRLQDLQARIAHAQYTVDPDAVARALLQHGTARGLLGLTGMRASGQSMLVSGELHGPAA
jgi:hypothetical protein